jgi:hypothetical protein
MLRFISWSEFLKAVSLLLAIYWVAILAIYYRREFYFLLNRKNPATSNPESQTGVDEEFLFNQCNDCAAGIKSLVRQRGLVEANKDVFISEIKGSLDAYKVFKGTKWQIPINNLICYEALQACSLQIDQKDLDKIWS